MEKIREQGKIGIIFHCISLSIINSFPKVCWQHGWIYQYLWKKSDSKTAEITPPIDVWGFIVFRVKNTKRERI